MKKCLCILFILWLYVPVYASPTIPPEVKSYLLHFFNEFSVASEAFISTAENTDDPSALAKALNTYTDHIGPLFAGLAELEEKHSSFFSMMEGLSDDDSIGDPDIDRAAENFEQYEDKMTAAMMKIFNHIDHPEILSALENLQNVMSYDDEDYDDEGEYLLH